jgi:hypothetical protein
MKVEGNPQWEQVVRERAWPETRQLELLVQFLKGEGLLDKLGDYAHEMAFVEQSLEPRRSDIEKLEAVGYAVYVNAAGSIKWRLQIGDDVRLPSEFSYASEEDAWRAAYGNAVEKGHLR